MEEVSDEQAWFDATVSPHGDMSSYCKAPPMGMTFPPRNPKVRQRLLAELKAYGIRPTPSRPWPPPKPGTNDSSRPQGLARTLGLTRTASSPAATFQSDGTTGAGGSLSSTTSEWKLTRPASSPKRIWRPPDDEEPRLASDNDRWQMTGMPTALWRPPRKLPSQVNLEHRRLDDVHDWQVRNAKEALRAQASLHTAAMSDKHRFPSGMSMAPAPAAWLTDAGDLANFHHAQLRKVAKSGLEVIKEPVVTKKKKRDEIEDLQLSTSGLFKPKYPVDGSLKSLRRLTRSLHLEAESGYEQVPDNRAASKQRQKVV
eukprot:CAMPEP_0172839658 /NCGR_PEP_ID=MMETSP1075-20121228/28723_1 /TAXON_ID=2916 /ORGANISM="Ceratium fusus, Strain PA161109" /LENGTH=312 /DNA_ID=CAMNT_0013683339 /DNA_START=26 /DNA_END=964 /DNA_ORIENTATION=-